MIISIIEHMRATMPKWFENVDGGASMEYILDKSRLALPAFYVRLQNDYVTEFSPTNVHVTVAEPISIIAVLDNTKDQIGKYAQDSIALIKRVLIACLMNYKTSVDKRPLIYVSGGMLVMDKARYVHEFVFRQEAAFDQRDGYQPNLDDFNTMYNTWILTQGSEETRPHAKDQIENIYPLN